MTHSQNFFLLFLISIVSLSALSRTAAADPDCIDSVRPIAESLLPEGYALVGDPQVINEDALTITYAWHYSPAPSQNGETFFTVRGFYRGGRQIVIPLSKDDCSYSPETN
jgi:hypothetical protein